MVGCDRACVPDLAAIERALGHRFTDPSLLTRALTHPSYVNEHPDERGGHNQRLEFLGDAVVDFVAARWVYEHYPEFGEGQMTRLRAALVRTETLAALARRVGIGSVLRLGRGEEESGGRERPANLCDAFEAVIGALYLDGGMEAVERFLIGLLEPVARETVAQEADWDAKSRLQEWSQAHLGVTPRYCIVAEDGPDHAKCFVAEVVLLPGQRARGSGRSKQAAEQAAAQQALEMITRAGAG
jgi:ribonuclease-3